MTGLDEYGLEARLRREMRAEAEKITQESLPGLYLPGRSGRAQAGQWPGGYQGPSRARPLFAAAAVVAVVAGTFTAARVISGPLPGQARARDTAALPAYYAYGTPGTMMNWYLSGVRYNIPFSGRYISVRATATGRLVTSLTPPKPYSNFTMLTADATGGEFVLGAARYWSRDRGAMTRAQLARSARTPVKFMMLRITAAGARLSGLTLPDQVTLAQLPSIALSPDGTRLALAAGGGAAVARNGKPAPPVVRVISLSTGLQHQWTMPHSSWTPTLSRNGAWTANGRTLALEENITSPPRSLSALRYENSTTQVRLLDTQAAGDSLAAASRLVMLHSPPHQTAAPLAPFLTPDGSKLITPAQTGWPGAFGVASVGGMPKASGELAVYSARTGQALHSVAGSRWSVRPGRVAVPAQVVAWSSPSGSQLVVLQPWRDRKVLGVLSGGRFVATGPPLPGLPAGYAQLQHGIEDNYQMTW